MRDRPKKEVAPPQFLSGWKEIASYLGKGVRTVQRYERQMGLPVRRPARKAWGSVIATKAELDAWVQASPIREVFRLRDPEPEYASMTRSITAGLSQMMRLRDQMFALRSEVRQSVRTLKDTVHTMQGALSYNTRRATSSLYSEHEMLEQYSEDESREHRDLSPLHASAPYRKVS